jgi:hypothetical protein
MSPGTPVIYTLVLAEYKKNRPLCNRSRVLAGKLKKNSTALARALSDQTHISNFFLPYINYINCIGCLMNVYAYLVHITQDLIERNT